MDKNTRQARAASPSTTFDRLMKRALLVLCPDGSATSRFVAPPGCGGYRRAVIPDFVLPDGGWLDFKLRVSFRDRPTYPGGHRPHQAECQDRQA